MAKKIFFGFVLALLGAFGAQFLHFPIPWMLGPLIVVAIAKVNGLQIESHQIFQRMGQWVIGTTLGLYFTPSMTVVISKNLIYVVVASLFIVFLGVVGAFLLKKFAHTDFKNAFFSCTIGGASEMTNLGERNGADPQLVASSHSLRMLIVVLVIPFAYKFLGIHGDNLYDAISPSVSYLGLAQLIFVTIIPIWLFNKFNIPNPWVLGPLFITVLLTVNNIHLSHLMPEMQKLSQLFIAWSLGNHFIPGFFKKSQLYLIVQALIVLFFIIACAIFAKILAFISNESFPTLMLGLSPGGIAEMTITAKVLMLGVPLVTAFHVVRMVVVLITAEPLFKWLNKRIK